MQDAGLSDTALQLGDCYSGSRKSSLGSQEKQVKDLQVQVQKLMNDKKGPKAAPNNNNTPGKKITGKKLGPEARKFLGDTCRNW